MGTLTAHAFDFRLEPRLRVAVPALLETAPSGEPLDAARLGWHGLDGDRRLAFRRLDERGGFPWLSASKLPDLRE